MPFAAARDMHGADTPTRGVEHHRAIFSRMSAQFANVRSPARRVRAWIDEGGSVHVRLFWMAAATLVLVVVGVTVAAERYVDRSERVIVGRSERVMLSTRPGEAKLSSAARLDTGADRSSIDRSIVDALGIDLTNAPTVQVGSSLGTEERKLVDIVVEFAGTTRAVQMSVADRTERSFPVLLGVDALEGFVVDPGRDDTMGETSSDVIDAIAVDATDRLVSGDLPVTLLILLPLAAGIVVGLRMVLGLQPLGTFAPVLLALAVTRAGAVFVLLAVAALAATFAFQPLIVRLRVPRQARLAILIGVVVLVWLMVLGPTSEGLALAQGVPVIVTVVVLDGLWIVLTDEGLPAALRTTLHTAIATLLVLSVISAASVRVLALDRPFLVAISGVTLSMAAGSYRGLRLTEFMRFRPRPTPSVAPDIATPTATHKQKSTNPSPTDDHDSSIEGPTMTVNQYVQLTGLSVRTVRQRCASGQISAEKQGRRWAIDANGFVAEFAGVSHGF